MNKGNNKSWDEMSKEEKVYGSVYTLFLMLFILFFIFFVIYHDFPFALISMLSLIVCVGFYKKFRESTCDIDIAKSRGISVDEWKRIKKWYKWEESVHYSEKQAERLSRAVNDDLKIKYINQKHGCGFIIGTKGEQYNVFLDHCSCPDYKRRQKPCKHMYRLALEIGIIDGPYC